MLWLGLLVSDKAEAEAYQDHLDDTISSAGDDLEEDIITDEIRTIMERSEREDDFEDEVETIPFEEDIEAKLKQEEEKKLEEESRRQEEERLAKKEKVKKISLLYIYLPFCVQYNIQNSST